MKTGFFISAFIFWFGSTSAMTPESYTPNTLNQVQEWVDQNVKYPEIAKTNKEEGVVYVEFEIHHGQISSTRIIQEAGPNLNKAALNIVQNLPSSLLKLTEKATYIMPIKFDLI
ncbi:MAG: TonB family protein [Crocinitomicaceae bacterium]|nr:TonB family protein [Crocinitomicaceae bacterium]